MKSCRECRSHRYNDPHKVMSAVLYVATDSIVLIGTILMAGVFSAIRAARRDRFPGATEVVTESKCEPIAPEATGRQDVQVAPKEDTPVSGDLRILVAEDNPINRKVIELLLKRMGYQADMAVDGKEAVEMASARSYDAILMDLHMPRMGGIEATREIVERVRPKPRVVAVTADATPQARQDCERVGMAAYLTKPVDSELLMHELKSAEAARNAFRRSA